MSGFVSLVGAGPGDPGLITVKAVERLKSCDVVVYDYLANSALLDYCPPQAERVFVGKQAGAHTLTQEEITALLVALGERGHRVVRLKGGDPYIFGRGAEEAAALELAGVTWEVIPGISAGVAVPAYAGIPVTHRDHASSVAMITGHEDPSRPKSRIDWAGLAHGADTLVFFMGVGNLAEISQQLIAAGRAPSTPVAVIRWGTLPNQQTVTATLADIAPAVAEAGLKPPAITVVGEVVRLRESLRWFDNRPLWGRRIIVTRAREQASDLAARLRDLGAEPLEYPVIAFAPPAECGPLDEAIVNIGRYSWLVFTSPNAVTWFMQRLRGIGQSMTALAGVQIAAIGPATAAQVEVEHLTTSFVPTAAVAEAILDEIGDVAGQRILLPHADLAREALAEGLILRGAQVDSVVTYRTVLGAGASDVAAQLRAGKVDAVTFTSSSTVTNFFARLALDGIAAPEARQLLAPVAVVAIGPITAATARDLGLTVAIEAAEYTVDGLVAALQAKLAPAAS